MLSEGLSKKEKVLEIAKVGLDIKEFIKYVRIQEPGDLGVEYKLWPHLAEFYEALRVYKLVDLIKAKQVGISWALAIYALWKIYTVRGWNVLMISMGDREAQELLSKSKVVYHNLPGWMKIYTLEPNSTERFGFKEVSSKITALPSTIDAGIGETAGTVMHDEAEFHEYFEQNLAHTRATVADSVERQLISVSTTNDDPDSYYKNHWKMAEAGKNGFKALFYGVFSRPDRDEAFYQQLVRENEATPWKVKRNYPRTIEEALSPVSAVSCFKKSALDTLWANRMETFVETRQNCIYILHKPQPGLRYTAGVDVGKGVGLDYSVCNIVGRLGLQSEVSAVIYSNTIGTDAFAFEVDRLCNEYFTPLLAVDNIGIGQAVVDKLQQLGYRNLFYSDKERKKPGWALNATSKSNNKRELVVKLVEAINNGDLITRWKPQIQELMEYQWVGDYPEPTGRTHGDTVIALMLANEMLKRVGTVKPARCFVDGVQIW